ncbi:MAG: NifU family protein [Bacteroidia bacterium]|nr:NifU family protein [Bacteroidia bacterium]
MSEYVIRLEAMSEPSLLKFHVNQPLSKENHTYTNIDEAKASPLAQQLFYLPFIKSVQILPEALILERFSIVEWDDVKDEVAQQVVEYLNAGGAILSETESNSMKAITLYAEVTPNPAVMKFVANKRLVDQMYEFKSMEEAAQTGLAEVLFEKSFVSQVFLDENYVSVSKNESAEWDEITMDLREFIRDYITNGGIVVSDTATPVQAVTAPENTSELDDTSQEIITILEQYVKPAVAMDGGNILFQSYNPDSKVVSVILQGACSGCPSSTYTLKNGIEQMLKNMLGDKVEEVFAMNG